MMNSYNAASYFKDFFQNMLNFSKSFDCTKSMSDFAKAFDANKLNMHLTSELNAMLNEKAQAIMSKQSEIFQENIENLVDSIKDISQNMTDPKKFIEKQNELSQQHMQRNMKYGQELANLYTQANTEILKKCFEQMQAGNQAAQDLQNK